MSVDLPTTPAIYISGQVPADTAEPFVLTAMGRWLWFRGPEVTPFELELMAPMVRLIPLDDEELAALHDIAGQIAGALRLNAIARERWGTTQADLTRDLTDADIWRAIAEKTGAQ